MPFPLIIYNYYKNIQKIREWNTVNSLKQCFPPFLDVGCGSKKISTAVQAVTVDVDRKHRPNVVASVLCLPFRDGCFETVSAFEVIEHVEDDELALHELKRVSRNKVVLSVPNALRYNIPLFPIKRKDFMSSDHKREYTLKEIVQLISRVKMHVNQLKGIGYGLPSPFSSLHIGLGIFPVLFPEFATWIYVECTKVKG
jgi:SAM-dependent methyltransferase